jgi:hypothetical protein
MTELIAFVAGIIWGVIWVSFLYGTKRGRWVRMYRTWITVVVGVGVTLLIQGVVFGVDVAVSALIVFAGSGTPIILASLYDEYKRDTE